ncbi:MAG: hypothetical protein SF097_18240 [Acidobacteriota bacterium]|nr:hypothetical protein [Acidobacteriota bacterium]
MDSSKQVDHLMLLVGTNPLPNWVVAQLLARPGGTVYLVATSGVKETRLRLIEALEKDPRLSPFDNKLKVEFTEITNEENHGTPDDIRASDVQRQVKALLEHAHAADAKRGVAGSYGLNYTGGTKMMAVHAYQAFKEFFKKADPQPSLSYLDARSLTLKFDQPASLAEIKLTEVSQYPQLQIGLETLFGLHGEIWQPPHQQTAIATAAAQGLIAMHSHFAGQKCWRDWCGGLKVTYGRHKVTKKVGEVNLSNLDRRDWQQIVSKLNGETLPTLSRWETDLKNHREIRKLVQAQQANVTNKLVDGYRQFLNGLNAAEGDTLKDAAQKSGAFADSLLLAKWLDGLWLEHYTFDQFRQNQTQNETNPNGLAINVESVNAQGRKFEADVIVLRGYQLFYCSCYAGGDPATAKRKLFEAMIRAEQLGGEEAKVALICCSDQPDTVEREAESDFQRKGMIRVFGRKHLPTLATELTDWLTGKK